jgi:hypothetical protein
VRIRNWGRNSLRVAIADTDAKIFFRADSRLNPRPPAATYLAVAALCPNCRQPRRPESSRPPGHTAAPACAPNAGTRRRGRHCTPGQCSFQSLVPACAAGSSSATQPAALFLPSDHVPRVGIRFLIVVGQHGTKLPAARCRKLASCTIAEPAAGTLKAKCAKAQQRRASGGALRHRNLNSGPGTTFPLDIEPKPTAADLLKVALVHRPCRRPCRPGSPGPAKPGLRPDARNVASRRALSPGPAFRLNH